MLGVIDRPEQRDQIRTTPEDVAQQRIDSVDPGAGDRGVELHSHIRDGQPAETILKTIGEQAIDLVVMGTHGRTGVERILGSVAEEVVRESPVPVLTVPPG